MRPNIVESTSMAGTITTTWISRWCLWYSCVMVLVGPETHGQMQFSSHTRVKGQHVEGTTGSSKMMSHLCGLDKSCLIRCAQSSQLSHQMTIFVSRECQVKSINLNIALRGHEGELHGNVRGLCLTFPTGLRMLWENCFTLFTALYTFCRSASQGLREVWITSLGPRSSEPWFDRQTPNVLKSRRCAQWAAFYVRNAT